MTWGKKRGGKWNLQTATVGTETLTFDLEALGAKKPSQRRVFKNLEAFFKLASPGTGTLAIEIEPEDFPDTWIEVGTYDLAAPISTEWRTQHYTKWRAVPTAASGAWSGNGTAMEA
jgi:hypothetical protein